LPSPLLLCLRLSCSLCSFGSGFIRSKPYDSLSLWHQLKLPLIAFKLNLLQIRIGSWSWSETTVFTPPLQQRGEVVASFCSFCFVSHPNLLQHFRFTAFVRSRLLHYDLPSSSLGRVDFKYWTYVSWWGQARGAVPTK